MQPLTIRTMEKGSLSVEFVHEALRALRAGGHDVSTVLQVAGIAPQVLTQAQGRITAERFSALWLHIAAVLDDEFFGCDSRRMKVGSFAAITYASADARTVHAALRRMIRLYALILDDTALALKIDGSTAILQLMPTPRARAAQRPLLPFAHETLLVLVYGTLCWLVDRRIPIARADFAYPAPARWPEYRLMYSSQLAFEQPQTQIAFDARLLELPVRKTQRSATAFLRQAPYNIVLRYKNTHNWSARVRHQLRAQAPEEWPTFAHLARALGVAPSTLRRALLREGSSYQNLKDTLRRDLALTLLETTEHPLPTIARRVGFAEPSAFHRAFKQWMGMRPGDYRQQQRGGLKAL